MTHPAFDLKKHLSEEHTMSTFAKYLKEIVYGGNDGIVTTFAVVAGFAGAGSTPASQLPVLVVLLFGFANLFADGVSMALGNFLSTRSEQDVYAKEKKKELHEIRTNPALEQIESEAILLQKGFTKEQAEQLVTIYRTNESYWLEFMMKDELEMASPEGDNPAIMASMTFGSFVTFGFIPLLPYVLLPRTDSLFSLSIIATATALSLLGILRWKITRQNPLRSIGETLLLGGAAAIVAYLVGTFFRL